MLIVLGQLKNRSFLAKVGEALKTLYLIGITEYHAN